jgi:hypothetical protein
MNPKRPDRAPHKRKHHTSDHTQNTTGYRITGSWNKRPDRPAIRSTQDRHQARRIAREMAEQGAYVVVEQHAGYGQWRTLYEVDGPALAAAVADELRRAEAERRAAVEAEQRRQAAAAKTDRDRAALARLMVQPPVPRDATGRVTVRHTAGA